MIHLVVPSTPPLHAHFQPLAITDLCAVPIVLPFPECHIVGIIQYVAFSDWLPSLSNMHLRFLHVGTLLVAQWLRIHLPMQETRVRALVQEEPTCRGATKPVCHNY